MGADTGEVLDLIPLLKAPSGVHDVAVVERILKRIGVLLHVFGKGYKHRALNMKVLVLTQVIRPWGHRSRDAITRVVVVI